MSSYELVYQKLRENILNGHYKHGDELRETAVGKEIGVSRTPVREALRQLELEGLVTIIPIAVLSSTESPNRMYRIFT